MATPRPPSRPTYRRHPERRLAGRWIVVPVLLLAIAGGVAVAASGIGEPGTIPSPSASRQAVVPASIPAPDATSRWTGPSGGWPAYSPIPSPWSGAASPTSQPTSNPDVAAGPKRRIATRVSVPDLRIDLPVMRQKTSYPACNVAMYLRHFKQPGQGGPTYLYAHAQRGMFLPLLTQSRRNNGKAMLGMRIFVYTGDNLRFEYKIIRVRRHAEDFRPVTAAKGETVWLQTSEGPNASYPKLQVAGRLVGSVEVAHDEAHPRPRPVKC
jgi:sortase (surface protein transpeptidase)